RVIAMHDPLGRTVSITYDKMSRKLTRTDPANATTIFTYDENGNKTSITNALGHTWTMQYNAKNKPIIQTFPLTPSDNGVQRMIRVEYNENDELITVIFHSNRIRRFTYDPRGQRKTMTDPEGGVFSYSYDINMNLISLSDQRNKTITWEYDELYRPI